MPFDNKRMLRWLYRSIDLSTITASIWRLPIRASEGYDWLLERIQARYFSDNADPSIFQNVRWRLEIPPREKNLQEVPVEIPLTLNPGIFDQTAGTTRPKEFFFKSPRIDWPILAMENFTIQLENFVGVDTINMLFIGHALLPEPYINLNE